MYAIALQIGGALGGLDVLIHNASSLGPVPLALLADTECEDFEAALATNVLGPFRLTKALLGLLAASARESGRAGSGPPWPSVSHRPYRSQAVPAGRTPSSASASRARAGRVS